MFLVGVDYGHAINGSEDFPQRSVPLQAVMRRFLIRRLNELAGLMTVLWALCFFGAILLGTAAIVVGAWDLLVWLTKSDWRTSNFNVSIYSGIGAFILLVMLAGIEDLGDKVLRWVQRLEEKSKAENSSS